MAEAMIPVSAIRKALAYELSAKRKLEKHNDAGLNNWAETTHNGQVHLVKLIELFTGTPIRRRPR